jgi:Endonuclease-reverse transcriptase
MDTILTELGKNISIDSACDYSRVVVGMDAKAHHPSWNSRTEDDDGRALFNFILEHELSVGKPGRKLKTKIIVQHASTL